MMMTRTPLYDEPHSSSFAMSLLERVILAIFFASIVIFISLDLFTDSLEGVSVAHLSTELIVAGIGGVGLLYLIWSGFRFRGQLVSTRRSLEEVSADAALFKKDSEKWVQGLGMVIDQQLSKWNLTETEKEVALLLLKGLSSKEIAAIRNTAEKTVRAQAGAIYEKSGLQGRAELSAFFLEDLLYPRV